MNKFIVVDNAAVDEIVANRFLQSTEFEQGRALLSLLLGEVKDASISSSIKVTRSGEGIYLTGDKLLVNPKFVVIDEEQSSMLCSQNITDALFSFQKLLRFAKKIWQGLSLTYSERLITGSSKAVLFPYRFKPAPFRIVIEREPWADRLDKRGQSGNWLLVYKAGHEGGMRTASRRN